MAHIVVIDDDDTLRDLIAATLTGVGHRVTLAADGVEGVEAVRRRRPDLVVTDMLMPRRDGVETICLLRNEQPGLPVIALSGDRRGDHSALTADLMLETAALLGARATLAKPFSRQDLLWAVEEALK